MTEVKERTRARGSRRRGRSSENAASAGTTGVPQGQYAQPKLPFAPMDLISADHLEAIHRESLKVLKEIGMEFMLPEARRRLKEAGADIQGERVRFEPELVEQLISTVPGEFTLHGRSPARNLRMGGRWIAYSNVSSPPNVSDLDNGRRVGNWQDFCNLVKLSQYFNAIHVMGGYPVEPVDIHPSIRHLKALREVVHLCDKPFHAYSLGLERISDGIEIARIARGVSDEQFDTEPSLLSVINTNSPLKLDVPMLIGITEMAKRNQVLIITPFTLAGAMAPVTVAGALVQQNAEALAGIAYSQVVRPGAPVIYGGFTSNVDMKSGAPAFGTPEYMQTVMVGAQLCRRYNVPYRTSNVCAANAVDAQAAYESVFSLWALTMAGGNYIKHGAGWMEGGLVASYEKFILDVDLLQMVMEFLKPIQIDEAALGLEAMKEVGPGGHFFGCQHTLERYESAFYQPILSDWRNFEQWQAAGAPEAKDKANRMWKDALADYTPPALDKAIAEELDEFVERRIEEGGAPTDF